MKKEEYTWPYGNEMDQEETIESDVLVLGGGLAGCFAAIAAARKGLSVTLVEKGATERSGSAGTGFDHWESACTNPCSGVTPEEIAEAYVNEQDWYSNGIAHYIECREGYDRMLDLESFGGKIRDTEDEFAGAEFRDEKTKLMFAYDYKNKFTVRVWGSTFKPALVKELKRLGVRILDRTEATGLLVAEVHEEETAVQKLSDDVLQGSETVQDQAACCESGQNAGEQGQDGTASGAAAKIERRKRCVGAMGMNVHTGKFYVFRARSTVLAMSRPARVWLFNADTTGLCEFRPMQSIGSGHAMGWRAGVEFTMMEKSVRAEFSAAGRSFPPYGAGNNHNTWYAATMVDARGVEIPYVDRDGKELKTVSERYYPAKGQKFFLKGGVIDNPKYEYRGPETLEFEELMNRGYQLPFYADLSRMPDAERRVIWGMMVGEEGKTKIPIYQNYTERGFDPEKHMLQSYGTGWQSANFLEQERQFFGAPGGLMHDWDLKTNIDGLYAGGDQLYASDCAGFACATGCYAGRKAADYAKKTELGEISRKDVEAEKQRLYAPLYVDKEEGIGWKELNMAISKAMQNYCGGVKCDALLKEGLDLLESYEREIVPNLTASNPHDLMRTHEVLDILTVAQLVLHASLARKSSSEPLCFRRSDYPEMDPAQDRKHIVIWQENKQVLTRDVPLDFFGKLQTEYEKRNQDYIAELADKQSVQEE
ncbi:MAG: FAD-dependent oxidoreductase [Lachnospiraceae bacterium]|nr:FAD-dependent oxidoreductase [Lachnospiraceae bacterium]